MLFDVAWMDDRTAPSVHVRHNIEGLSALFPPAYLLSFVTDHDGEPLHDAPDLSTLCFDRMEVALGVLICERRPERHRRGQHRQRDRDLQEHPRHVERGGRRC